MRVALWFLGLFGVAAALALFAGNNQGTVTVFWPPYRVDLSLNLVLLGLVAVFATVHVAMRALGALFDLPQQARRWRVQQKERALLAALVDAMAQLLAGRFVRSRKAALSVLAQEHSLVGMGEPLAQAAELRALAHVLAAESAHSLQDRARRDRHLEQCRQQLGSRLTALAQSVREGALLRTARWTLDDRDPAGALAVLAELPQGVTRRTLALRIRLKAARLAGHVEQALDTARLLAKHRAFSGDAARSVVSRLVLDMIHGAHDTAQLERAWASLEASEQALPDVATAAALRWSALRGDDAVARAWLLPVWMQLTESPTSAASDSPLSPAQQLALVQALEAGLESLDAAWLGRIEAAQQLAPANPLLQYLAGMACMHRQLWGKAQQLLTQAAPALQSPDLRRRTWLALAELAEQRNDTEAQRRAWQQASGAQ